MFADKAAWDMEGSFLLSDLDRSARLYKQETVSEALHGEGKLASKKAQDVVARMRAMIDGMTDIMLDRGLFHPDIEADVRARKGHYMHRSYQIFDDPYYHPTAAKKKALRKWLVAEHPTLSPEEIDGLLSYLETWPRKAGGVAQFFSKASPTSKAGFNHMANEIFKKLTNVPEVLRDFWGEYKDPRVEFAKTAGSMADVLAKNAMLDAFVQAGAGRWFHTRPIETSDGMFSEKVPQHLPVRLDPTRPLYTSKEILQSLEDTFNPKGGNRALGIINAIAKWGKTVGSFPASHVRNYVTWYFLAAGEGNWSFAGFGRSHRSAGAELFGTDDAALRAELIDAAKYGVIGRGAKAGELNAQIKEALGAGWEGFMPKPGAMVLKGAVKLYRKGDDVGTFASWLYNRELYAKATGKSVHDPDIKRRAADIAQNINPTYDMAPQAVQIWRHNPFFGPFVVWPAEIIRTQVNRIRLAAEELRTPGLEGIGARRLASMLAVNAILYGGVKLLSQLWAGLNDDDDEKARRLLAPWDKDALLVWTRFDKATGQGTFINLSYTVPTAMFMEPIIAVLKGDPEEPAIKRAIQPILEDFFSPELGLTAIAEAGFNRSLQTGQPLARGDDLGDHLIKRGGRILEALLPNTINILNRIYKGYVGHESEWKKYDFKTELGAGLGVRFTTTDISLQWRGKDFMKAKTQAGYEFRRAINALGGYHENHVRSTFGKTVRLREQAYGTLIGQVEAARQLGRSDVQIKQSLRKGGVAEKDCWSILKGKIPPFTVDRRLIRSDRIANRPERIALVQSLLNAEKERAQAEETPPQ